MWKRFRIKNILTGKLWLCYLSFCIFSDKRTFLSFYIYGMKSDDFPTVSETVKAIKRLSSCKAPGSNTIPAEVYKAGGPPVAEKLFHIMWRKKAIPQEFKDALLYTYSNGKGILRSVTIIGASLYCQLLGRSLQESYWTDWMNTLISQGFYQKANVDSGRTEEQLAWSSQLDSFKRNARNRMWTSAWLLLTLPKHLTQSVVRDFGKLWQSLAVRPSP